MRRVTCSAARDQISALIQRRTYNMIVTPSSFNEKKKKQKEREGKGSRREAEKRIGAK